MSGALSDSFIPGLVSADQAEHLIIPWAACDAAPWWPTVNGLPPPQRATLSALLQGLQIAHHDLAPASSLSPPHERALARALDWTQLDDGLLPWAALGAGKAGQACGWISLCHWVMGREQATLGHPDWLQIRGEESAALLQAMRPFFQSEGIELQALDSQRWLACGSAMELPCAALDRVVGRDVDPWLPAGVPGRLLRRLQNEMQMLLYTHPVNEARAQRGEPAINSLWFSGTGCLPAGGGRQAAVHMPHTLTRAALADDWLAYAQAWVTLEQQALRPLLARLRSEQAVSLTLCGERGALTLHSAQATLWQKLKTRLAAPRWPDLLKDRL